MKVWNVIAILMVAMALGACKAELRELCYDHSHMMNVRTNYQWAQSEGENVKGMTTLFYDTDLPGSEPIRYDFIGREGGTARLAMGNYQAVGYNNDTETILYRGMESLSTLEAYTRRSSVEEGTQLTRAGMPRAVGTEDEPVILEPDMLWEAHSQQLDLRGVSDTTLTLHTAPRVQEIEVYIRNVPNLEYTGQFGGALSGLASSVQMETGKPGEQLATQAFTIQVLDQTTLYMRFRTFGHCPHRSEEQVNDHLLTIYAILADGTKWYYSLNVSKQMHDNKVNPDEPVDPDNPTVPEIEIEIEGLPLPKPMTGDSGFQPSIDGWQTENIDVTM